MKILKEFIITAEAITTKLKMFQLIHKQDL